MMRKYIIAATLLAVAWSCARKQRDGMETPESVLTRMRADSCWIYELDSLAQIAIGPGARCLDPVKHTFYYERRTWCFNQDWGGVLEIPSGYLPEDDPWQAELSFHGARAWSPDSLILVSFYAGFQTLTREESLASIADGLKEDGFSVQGWDVTGTVLTIRARSAGGLHYYGRHIFANEDGVEYAVSVQYPDGMAGEALSVMEMADRYPAGPNGTLFKGEAL